VVEAPLLPTDVCGSICIISNALSVVTQACRDIWHATRVQLSWERADTCMYCGTCIVLRHMHCPASNRLLPLLPLLQYSVLPQAAFA